MQINWGIINEYIHVKFWIFTWLLSLWPSNRIIKLNDLKFKDYDLHCSISLHNKNEWIQIKKKSRIRFYWRHEIKKFFFKNFLSIFFISYQRNNEINNEAYIYIRILYIVAFSPMVYYYLKKKNYSTFKLLILSNIQQLIIYFKLVINIDRKKILSNHILWNLYLIVSCN